MVVMASRRLIQGELDEMAATERAGAFATFRHITLPLMAPVLLLLAARDVIFSLQITFVPAMVIFDGGPPPNATTYLPFFIYRNGFEYLRYGYAAAATVVMFAATVAIIAIQLRIARRWTDGVFPADRGSSRRHVAALPLAVILLLPLAVMIGGSLRQVGLPPPRTPELPGWPLEWENYGQAADLVNLARLTLNSLIVALLSVPLSVLVASWAGFAISRLPLPQARLMVGVSLLALMVPLTAMLVGRFTIFAWLGVTDTFVPLIASSLIGTSPLYVLVYYWAFRGLPAELFEAARLEGLSLFRRGVALRCHWRGRSRLRSPRWPLGSSGKLPGAADLPVRP